MSPTLIQNSTRFGVALFSLLFASASFASDVAEITLDGHQTNYAFSLDGAKTRTVYREESYESTCSREEEYTAYRQECDYQTVQRCHEEGGGQSCHSVPECHDTTRPVCNSHGCTNEPTHECTSSESCTSEPSRTVCESEQVATNCRDVPYTATNTVEYACTKTRQVPIGTELVEQMAANVTIAFTGDLQGLTGKDRFKLSLANGNDLSRDDLLVESIATGDSHFFRLTKVSEAKKPNGDKKSIITAAFKIDAVPYASILVHKTNILDLDAIRGAITFTTAGEAIDPSVVLHVVSKKHRLLGGWKQDFEQDFKAENLTATPISGGQNIQVNLGACLNTRPHEFTLTLTRDVGKLLGDNVLNLSTAEKAKKDLTTTFTKQFKLNGKQKDQCGANDGQQSQ